MRSLTGVFGVSYLEKYNEVYKSQLASLCLAKMYVAAQTGVCLSPVATQQERSIRDDSYKISKNMLSADRENIFLYAFRWIIEISQ